MKITLKIDENALPGVLLALRKYADEADKVLKANGYRWDNEFIKSHPYAHNRQAIELLHKTRRTIISQRDDQTSMRDLRADEASERFMHA